MDYKKKYEEALERAKAGKPMDEVFPELAESEDERIRKALIVFICEFAPEHLKAEFVAYLEKQKENPKNDSSISTDCASSAKCENEHNKPGDFVFELRQIISRHWYADMYSECVDDEEGMAREILSLCEKQKEQKPVEYPEKGNEYWFGFNEGKGSVLDHPEEYGLIKPAEWSEEDKTNFAWFDKFFRAESIVANGRDIPQDKYLWFKSIRPQPKAEWSKEDEKILRSLITDYEYAVSGSQPVWKENFQKKLDWLKFLPERFNPQPHWKPSEEQMGALLELEKTYVLEHERTQETAHLYMIIKSLREQLLKLM